MSTAITNTVVLPAPLQSTTPRNVSTEPDRVAGASVSAAPACPEPTVDDKIAALADMLRSQYLPSTPTSDIIAALSGPTTEQQAIDVLRERTQPRPDVIEHNGRLIDPVGTLHPTGTDVWMDGTWKRYGHAEIQLESGIRMPAWSAVKDPTNVTKVKEIKLGEDNITLPVSGNAGELLAVRLPGDPLTGNFDVTFGAELSPLVRECYVRRGDEYYICVVMDSPYEDAQVMITPKAAAESA